MAWHVNECEVDVARLQMREAKIDSDAARLFFLQAIRIGAGQCAHERALSMVDVTSRADDNGTHIGQRFRRAARSFRPGRCAR